MRRKARRKMYRSENNLKKIQSMLALALALAGFQSFSWSKPNRKLLLQEIQVFQEYLQVPATSTHNSQMNTRMHKCTARIPCTCACTCTWLQPVNEPWGAVCLTMGPGDPLSSVRLKIPSVMLASSCWQKMELAS